MSEALIAGDFERAQLLSRNDLEAPAIALMPEIGACMRQFEDAGARYVRMSGSGSTVYGVFDSMKEAQAVAARYPGAVAVQTITQSV